MNIGAIIQARMASERLPSKVLMPLPYPTGKPLLKIIVAQLKKSELIHHIVVATTTNPKDDIVKTFTEKENIICFRGDEKNVFKRFQDVCKLYNLDVIVRVTGDNPIIDHNLLDQILQQHIDGDKYYTKTSGLPMGMNFEIFSGEKFLQIPSSSLTQMEKEHVTLVLAKEPEKMNHIKFNFENSLTDLRLTLDYPEDLAMFSVLLNVFDNRDNFSQLERIKKVLKTHPWIFEINRSVIQKKAFSTLEEECLEAAQVLEKLDMPASANVLRENANNTQK